MFSIIYLIPNVTCKLLYFLLRSSHLPASFSQSFLKKKMYGLWKQSIIAYKGKRRHSEHLHPDNPLAMEPSGQLASYTNIPLWCYTKGVWYIESPW